MLVFSYLPSRIRRLATALSLMLAFVLCLGVSLQATTLWTGSVDSDWQVSGNWNNGVPSPAQHAQIFNGDNVVLDDGTATARMITVQGGSILDVISGASLISERLTLGGITDGSFRASGPGTTVSFVSDTLVDVVIGSNSGNGTMTVENGAVVQTGFGASVPMTFLGNTASGSLFLNGTPGSRGVYATDGIRVFNGTGTLSFDGGVLRALTNQTDFLQNFEPGDVTIGAGGAFFDTNGFTVGISTVMTGAGAFTKEGGGTLTLSGANTYTGGTNVNAGVLHLATGGTLGHNSGTVTVAHGAALELGGSVIPANPMTIAGTGTGAGALVSVAGNNSANGLITLSGPATIGVTNGAFLNMDGGGITGAGQDLTFAGNGNILVSGAISTGSGSVTTSVDTLTLSGANTYTGDTIINGGRLFVSGGQAIADTGAVIVNSGGELIILASVTIGAVSGAGQVSIGTGQTLTTGGNNASTVFSGRIVNAGSLIKEGTGTLTLSGNNTYSGGTTIADGTLQIGAGGTTGSITGNVTNNGELAFNRSDALTFGGVISGTGSVTQRGSGTTILTGVNTYSGGTTIADGTLQIGSGGTTGSITGNVTNNGELAFNRSDALTVSGNISGTGSVMQNGTGTLTLSGSNTYSGGTNLNAGTIVVTGSDSLGTGLVTLGNGTTLGRTIPNLGLQNDLVIDGGVTFSGQGSGNVSFFGAVTLAPGNHAITSVDQDTTSFAGPISGIGGLTIAEGSVRFIGTSVNTYTGLTTVLDGATLFMSKLGDQTTIAGDLQINGNGLVRASQGNRFGAGSTVTVDGNFVLWNVPDLTIPVLEGSGEVLSTAFTATSTELTIESGDFSGSISDSDPLSELTLLKTTGGTLILTGNNTYSGGTTIADGTLQIGAGGTTGSITGNVTNNGELAFNRSDDRTYGGVISGTGSVTQRGTGTTILTGANTYSGGTTVEDGTLQIGSGGTTGSITGNVTNNGELAFNRSNALTFGGIISGTGAVAQDGSGTLILTGNNTYSGGTTISSGTLQLGDGGTTGSIFGNVTNNGELAFNRSDTLTFGGIISGTGSVTQRGSGTTILTGANTYTGGTVIDGGTLRIGVTGATGSGTITVLGSTISYADGVVEHNPIDLQNDVFLEVLGTDNARQNGPIGETGGSYGIIKIGEGTLRLTGANTFTGRTEVNKGTLVLRNGGIINSDEAVFVGWGVDDDGTLRVNGTGAGASLTTQDRIVVGRSGDGRLVVINGGLVDADVVRLGGQEDGDGFVLVSGAGSRLTAHSVLNVGARASGMLEVVDGGVVNTQDMFVGRQVDSVGGVMIDGTDSRLNATGEVTIANPGTGEMYILGGSGVTQDGDAGVGVFVGALGAVIVAEADSFWEIGGDLMLGDDGVGLLVIAEGGRVEAAELVLGSQFDGVGALLVDEPDSILTLTGSSVFGDQGIAQVAVEDGATLTQSGSSFIGRGVDGDGDVLVRGAGSHWTIGDALHVGDAGSGLLRVHEGGQVTTESIGLGVQADSFGVVRVRGAGSVLTNTTGEIQVGVAGEGRLLVRDGGRVHQASPLDGPMVLASDPGSTGILSIGARTGGPVASGIVDVSSVFGGDGDAVLNFNHTDGDYFFTRDGTMGGAPVVIAGSTAVNQMAGHTTLNAHNTHTGGTALTGGTLVAAHGHALGAGPLEITGGNLVVPQPVQVGGPMTWDGGTIFQTLGDDTTSIGVAGALVLTAPGTFDFTPGPGFRNKTDYLLISTTGALPYDTATEFIGNTLFGLDPEFRIDGGDLLVRFPGSLVISGAVLQNSNPVDTPFFADFVVIGSVRTGGPTENNMVDSLTFRPGSSLQVFNVLQVTTGNLDVPDGQASLSGGTLFVPEDLIRTGGGILGVGSNVNVNGAVNLNEGMTRLNGIVTTPGGLTVAPGAGLGGAGQIVGDVVNNGLVSPGNSIGTLTVNGNYTQSPGGTFLAEVTSGGRSDTLFVTGQARLAGTLRVSALGPVAFGDTTTIVVAQGGIVGRFDRVVGAPAGFRARQWTSGPRPNNLNLVFAPASYTQVAQGSNQLELARALDQWIGIEGGEIGAATLQLDFLRAGQYPLVFGAILPTLYENISAVQFQQSYADGRTVIRQAEQAHTAPRAARGEEDDRPRWRVWADARGMYSEQSPLDLDSKGGTVLAGADVLAREDLSLSFYAGGSHLETDDRRPGYRGNSVQMGLYAAWRFLKQAYVSAVVGGGKSSMDTRRVIAFGANADAEVDSIDWFGRLETGYRVEAGGFQLTPFAGLQWSENRFESFRETSDSVFALGVDSWTSRRLDGYIGLEGSYPIVVREHFRVSPYARVTLRDSLHQDDSVLRARLNRGDGPAFTYRGDGVDADGVELGGGLQIWDTCSTWMLRLGYTTLQGNDSTYQQINLGLSIGL